MGTTSIVEVRVSDTGSGERGGRLRLPADAQALGGQGIHARLDLPAADDVSLRPLVAALDRAGSSQVSPLVLLGGPWLAQVNVVRALIRRDASLSDCRIVHCVSGADRPLRFDVPARWIHGLILDAPPLELERESWSHGVLPDWAARTAVVPASSFPATPATVDAPGDRGSGPTVALIAEDAGPWLALGMQAFRTWSVGGAAVCRACRALSLPRLATERGQTCARRRCTFCGSDAIQLSDPVPNARLVVARVRHWTDSPDPDTLAEWLGILQSTRVMTQGDGAHAVSHAITSADVALVLGDPVFDAALVAALAHATGACVTNVGSNPTIVGRQCSWDHRGHMSAYPSERELVSALARAQEPGPLPSRSTLPAEQYSAAWARAITQLDRAPYVPPRARSVARRPRTHARGD